MKKVLSFIILMVCAVTGAWAAVTVTPEGTTLTIRTDAAGELATSTYSFTDAEKAASKLVLVGKFSDDDLKKVSKNDGGFSNVTEVDLSGATLVDKCTSANTPTGSVSDYSWFKTQAIANASGVKSPTKAIVGGTLYKCKVEKNTEWVQTTTETEDWRGHVLYESEDEMLNANVPEGSYAKIPQNPTYVYVQDKGGWWDTQNATTTKPDNIEDSEIKIINDIVSKCYNYSHYGDGTWVRFYDNNTTFTYWKFQVTNQTRSWDTVTDKDNVALSYVYPEGTDITTANTTATDGQYAVVGGTEYVFDGTEWNTPGENTYMVNWEKMQKQD